MGSTSEDHLGYPVHFQRIAMVGTALDRPACLVLGMEVPTMAAYVICVSVAGPALTELGLQPLLAHLFVFWFALLSTITPPVCGGVFIAAGMVGENWLKVAMKAMALGIGLYIIPLAMVANPDIIRLAQAPFAALINAGQIALGLTAISYGGDCSACGLAARAAGPGWGRRDFHAVTAPRP